MKEDKIFRHKCRFNTKRSTRPRGRRAGGKKQRSRSGHFGVIFANTTYWSSKAADYLQSKGVLSFIAVETHVQGDCLKEALNKLGSTKWRCCYAPPDRTVGQAGAEGSQGGAIAGIRPSVHHLNMPEAMAEQGGIDGVARSIVPHTAGWQVTLQGATPILIMGAYHRGGLQDGLMGDLARVTVNGAVPFVYAADWNCSPQEVEESGWPAQLGAEVLCPSNVEATCIMGEQDKGTMIDFVLVSRSLRPLLKVTALSDVPWSPYVGLHLAIQRAAQKHVIKTIPLPPRFRGAAAKPSDELSNEEWRRCFEKKDDAPQTTEARTEEKTTNSFRRIPSPSKSKEKTMNSFRRTPSPSKSTTSREAHRAICETTQKMGIEEESQKLADSLKRWSDASEQWFRQQCPSTTTGDRGIARCSIPATKTVQAVEARRSPAAAWQTSVATGTAVRLLECLGKAFTRSTSSTLSVSMAATTAIWDLLLGENKVAKHGIETLGLGQTQRLRVHLSKALLGDQKAHDTVKGRIEALLKQWKAKQRSAHKSDWKEWVAQALEAGAGMAHKWTNKTNQPKTAVPAQPAGPEEKAETAAKEWSATWHAEAEEEHEEAMQAFQQLRQRCTETGEAEELAKRISPRLAPGNLRKLCKSFKKSTSIGSDAWTFDNVASLPDLALQELGKVFLEIIKTMALPTQLYYIILALLPKKKPGFRTIAIIASTVRILMKVVATEFRTWDRATATMTKKQGVEDSAAPGTNAQYAATKRQAFMEAASWNDEPAIVMLWDMSQFYDSVKIPMLIKEAKKWEMPEAPLCVSLLIHLSPRVLRIQGAVSEPIVGMGRSIVAGCSSSTSLARAALLTPVLKSSEAGKAEEDEERRSNAQQRRRPATVMTGQHVDDVSQLVTGETEEDTLRMATRVGSSFAKTVTQAGFEISEKSVAVASSTALARKLVARLKAEGVQIGHEEEADDLGVAFRKCARKRCAAKQKERIEKGRRRAKRIAVLTKQNTRARQLYNTGAKPQMLYGQAALGLAPGTRKSIRRIAFIAASPPGVQACPQTAVEWLLGQKANPVVQCKVEQVKAWIILWRSASEDQRQVLLKAWRKAARSLSATSQKQRWKSIRSDHSNDRSLARRWLEASPSTLLDSAAMR